MNESQLSDALGYFQADVSTAGRALPVEGAIIQIFHGAESSPRFRLITNENGITDRVALPAPDAEKSRHPGNGSPFANYRATVTADGYYTMTVANLPVFAGIISDLPVRLIPLSAFRNETTRPEDEITTVTENPQVLSEENT